MIKKDYSKLLTFSIFIILTFCSNISFAATTDCIQTTSDGLVACIAPTEVWDIHYQSWQEAVTKNSEISCTNQHYTYGVDCFTKYDYSSPTPCYVADCTSPSVVASDNSGGSASRDASTTMSAQLYAAHFGLQAILFETDIDNIIEDLTQETLKYL